MNRKTLVDLTCPECKQGFKCTKVGDYFCSKRCYQAAYERKHRYEISERKNKARKEKKIRELGLKFSFLA